MSDDWTDWVGLPHRPGADPREGGAACCFVTSLAVCDISGAPRPSFDQGWLMLYFSKRFNYLRHLLMAGTSPVKEAGNGCISIIAPELDRIAIATWVDGGALFVSESNGLLWAPSSAFYGLHWRTYQ